MKLNLAQNYNPEAQMQNAAIFTKYDFEEEKVQEINNIKIDAA